MANNPKEIQDKILLYTDFETAPKAGNEYCIKKLYDPKKHTWKWACKNGHLDVVKFLHKNRTKGCTTYAMNLASKYGHLEVVKFLHENRTEGCTTDAMIWASCNGHLEVVKWLHENRTEGCTFHAMDDASQYGHLDVVKFLHENRTEGCTVYAMYFACQNGHLEVVKFLNEIRTQDYTRLVMDWANGHLEILIFLQEKYGGIMIKTERSDFKLVDKKEICSICLEDDGDRVSKCGHFFHEECVFKWIDYKCNEFICPVCRHRG